MTTEGIGATYVNTHGWVAGGGGVAHMASFCGTYRAVVEKCYYAEEKGGNALGVVNICVLCRVAVGGAEGGGGQAVPVVNVGVHAG